MDVADAAAAAIRGWFPTDALLKVEVHDDGVFDEDELKRLGGAKPSVYVSFVRSHANESSGDEDAADADGPSGLALPPPLGLVSPSRRDVELEYAAVVLARDRGRGRTAGRVAEAIAAELLRRIPHERWGLAEIRGAGDVRLVNWYSQDLAKVQLALWAVTWRQTVRLGDPWPEGVVPTELCVSVRDDPPEALA